MRRQTLNYLLIPKLQRVMIEALHLLFVLFCLSQGSAGSFFNLKCGPVLFGMHATGFPWVPLPKPCCYQPCCLSDSLRETATQRITIPIHTPHCIDTKPRTDSSSTSPLIASLPRIRGAKSRVGLLIPISPIISRVYWYMKSVPGNKQGQETTVAWIRFKSPYYQEN